MTVRRGTRPGTGTALGRLEEEGGEDELGKHVQTTLSRNEKLANISVGCLKNK